MSSFQWIHDTTASSGVGSVLIRACNNEITFNGDINAKNINDLIKLIDDTIVSLKSKNTSSMSNKIDEIELILYIDSNGGYLKDTYKFHDYINIIKRIHKVKLTTVGMGIIASAATLMHAIGDEKYITSNSEVMIHELYTGFSGKYTECKSYLKSMNDTHEKLIKIYMKSNKKNITREKLEELLRAESWFTAEEYIELGFADSIYE